MTRWMSMLAAGSGLLVLTVAPPALADGSCPTLDLACVADGTPGGVGHAIAEIVKPVEETTEPVVELILEEVDAIVRGGEAADPPGGSGHEGRPGVGENGVGNTTGGGQGRDGRLAQGSSRVPQQVSDGAGVGSQVIGPRGDDPFVSDPRDGLGSVLAGAARSTLVVLLLLGLTLVFVAIQNRLDRDDPKLALAQVRPDVLRFE